MKVRYTFTFSDGFMLKMSKNLLNRIHFQVFFLLSRSLTKYIVSGKITNKFIFNVLNIF